MRSRSVVSLLSAGVLLVGLSAGGPPDAAALESADPGAPQRAGPSAATVHAAAAFLLERLGPELGDASALAAGAQVVGFANFDGGLAPCDFEDVNAFLGTLGELKLLGSFGNGGAILNDCARVGVDALSGENFLAFDASRTLLNGNRPVLPELVAGPAATLMGFSVATDATRELTILGLNENGVTDVRTFTTVPGQWETHFAFTGGGVFFSAIVVIGFAPQLVIDDVFALRF